MNTKTKNIFIVDDIEENLQVVNDILEQNGTKLSFAQSGKEALEAIPKVKPDLILLDLFMPEMDGFEVCEKLKADEKTADIPVVFLTAGIEIENIVKAFELGAVDYITKPFNPSELVTRVNTHIGFKKARDLIEIQKNKLEQTSIELKRSVAQLEENEKKYNDIFEFSPLPTIIIFEDRIVMANKAALSFFEANNKAELLEKKISSFIYTDSKSFEKIKQAEIINGTLSEKSFYRKITTLKGKIREIEASEIIYKYQDKPAIEVVFKDITEKIEAKRALKENNRRHGQILDGFVDAVYICDSDYKVIYQNKAMKEKIGYDATGDKCHKAIYNLNGVCKWCTYDKLKEGNEKENEFENYDSRRKMYHSIKNILLDDGSKLAIYHDITKYKRIEKEIRKSERYFRKIYDNTPFSIITVNSDGIITDANLATLYLFNLSGFHKITGFNIEDFQGLKKEEFINDFNNVIKNGGEFHQEYKFISSPEILTWLNCHFIPVKDSKNKVETVYLMLEDITDRKLAEADIRKLSTAVKQSPTSILITNKAGNIEYINPKFLEITGYNSEEVIGKNPRIMQSGKTPPATYKELWKAITSGNTWHGEFINKKKNGDEFIEECVIAPIKDGNDHITNYIALKEDITKRKIAEKEASDMALFARLNPEPVFRFDKKGIVLQANPAANIAFQKETIEGLSACKCIKRLEGMDFKVFIKQSKISTLTEKVGDKTYRFILRGLAENNVCQIYGFDITKEEETKEVLKLKQEELENNHKSIISSISYARVIQKAVLPTENFLKQFLPESFVLFMPRDIVSGDFYWIKQIQHKIFIAAADCTGHGVPGAFMSMLGTTLLTEIVTLGNDVDTYKANMILNELRKKLKLALHQDRRKDTASDGMDIALIIIDIENKKMQYAGANNPLYLIRNEGVESELIQYKPDRMPVGVHLKERSFTNHEIVLKTNDLIYIFSDGFVDQFGGKDDRKYSPKKFREFVLNISQNSLKEQKQLLNKEFELWKDKRNQLDDVLVMGMKISESYGEVDLF